jgi:ubiquitin-conjugating enzyme E2 O
LQVVYYHSGGLRLNPNLYENGNVCLSLLNTWRGKGTELWDASNSSILQLLISLQGLVLNANPYFNEAGYERQIGLPEGEKNSLMYNENAFLLSYKSILYLLHRPPQVNNLYIFILCQKKHFLNNFFNDFMP